MSSEKDVEVHTGTIMKIEDDFTEVFVKTPAGRSYTRNFETPFLEACGVEAAGDEIALNFSKMAGSGWGIVLMLVTVKKADMADLTREAEEIMATIDLEKVRAKFITPKDGE